MALDWKKAFDSIAPPALTAALRRFGLPEHVLDVIASIYTDRRFRVRDCGQTSDEHIQHSGISQGCPLSPFLFVMLMSVLIKDVIDTLGPLDKERYDNGDLAESLYAEDTLIIGTKGDSISRFLAAVSHAGAQYGLELHFGKFQF